MRAGCLYVCVCVWVHTGSNDATSRTRVRTCAQKRADGEEGSRRAEREEERDRDPGELGRKERLKDGTEKDGARRTEGEKERVSKRERDGERVKGLRAAPMCYE